MPTNPYISLKNRGEQNLYEDIVIEAIKFYGQDVYYLPREVVEREDIFLDAIQSQFSDAYKVETYIENAEGFEGRSPAVRHARKNGLSPTVRCNSRHSATNFLTVTESNCSPSGGIFNFNAFS